MVALAVLALLLLERMVAGVRAWRATREIAALAIPVAHFARDVCWSLAMADWCARRVLRVPGEPAWSMPRRRGSVGLARASRRPRGAVDPDRVLVLVPAYNESESLAAVIEDVRVSCPRFDLLVVDDGSTDGTSELLARLGAPSLRLPQHLGLGSAMRVGLRHAAWLGYRTVVRVDGDGQHDPADVERLLEPIRRGRCDAARGSRYLDSRGFQAVGWRRLGQRMLAFVLGRMTRRAITDPTSGYWVFGPRALALLAEHHPTGFPEPELSLLLHRNGLATEEVSVTMRPRRAGSSTFTLRRGLVTAGCIALAVMIVPWRAPIEVAPGD
jgi:hypothetical protein